MRLRGIKSIEGANKFLKYYLPIFNKRYKQKQLNYKEITKRSKKQVESKLYIPVALKGPYISPPDHPWKRSYPHNSTYQQKEEVGQEEKEQFSSYKNLILFERTYWLNFRAQSRTIPQVVRQAHHLEPS